MCRNRRITNKAGWFYFALQKKTSNTINIMDKIITNLKGIVER